MLITGVTRVESIKDQRKVDEIIASSFSISFCLLGKGKDKGEATPNLPNVPVARDGELPPDINPESCYSPCSKGSDQVVWMVLKCC